MNKENIEQLNKFIESKFHLLTCELLEKKKIIVVNTAQEHYVIDPTNVNYESYLKFGLIAISKFQTHQVKKFYPVNNPELNIKDEILKEILSSVEYREISVNYENGSFEFLILKNYTASYIDELLKLDAAFKGKKKLEFSSFLLEVINKKQYLLRKTLYCQGITLDKEKVEIAYKSIRIVFRRPEPEEFIGSTYKINCVLELYTFMDDEGGDIIIDNVFLPNLIRLYSVNSFSIKKSISKNYFSFFINKGTISTPFNYGNFNLFHLKIDQNKKLQEFFDVFSEKVLKILLSDNNKDNYSFSVKLATKHYGECLLGQHVLTEMFIMQSVMGLEAIWLTENDRETIGFKLKIRVAKILGLLGHDAEGTAKLITLGYSIRSSFAHGSPLKSDIFKKITRGAIKLNDLKLRLSEILRISILFSVLNLEQFHKGDFISLLNKAIYDNASNIELREIVEKVRVKMNKTLLQ